MNNPSVPMGPQGPGMSGQVMVAGGSGQIQTRAPRPPSQNGKRKRMSISKMHHSSKCIPVKVYAVHFSFCIIYTQTLWTLCCQAWPCSSSNSKFNTRSLPMAQPPSLHRVITFRPCRPAASSTLPLCSSSSNSISSSRLSLRSSVVPVPHLTKIRCLSQLVGTNCPLGSCSPLQPKAPWVLPGGRAPHMLRWHNVRLWQPSRRQAILHPHTRLAANKPVRSSTPWGSSSNSNSSNQEILSLLHPSQKGSRDPKVWVGQGGHLLLRPSLQLSRATSLPSPLFPPRLPSNKALLELPL